MKKRYGTLLLLGLAAAASLLLLLGHLSGTMTLEVIEEETREDVLEMAGAARGSGGGVGELEIWAAEEELARNALPSYFAQGPGRGEAPIEVFLRPRFVLRPKSPAGSGEEKPRGRWAYVVTRPWLPFLVRSHFGYFETAGGASRDGSGGDAQGCRIEGVRTYLTLFGRRVVLNQWAVRPQWSAE